VELPSVHGKRGGIRGEQPNGQASGQSKPGEATPRETTQGERNHDGGISIQHTCRIARKTRDSPRGRRAFLIYEV
jgi:hypothetical protein